MAETPLEIRLTVDSDGIRYAIDEAVKRARATDDELTAIITQRVLDALITASQLLPPGSDADARHWLMALRDGGWTPPEPEPARLPDPPPRSARQQEVDEGVRRMAATITREPTAEPGCGATHVVSSDGNVYGRAAVEFTHAFPSDQPKGNR